MTEFDHVVIGGTFDRFHSGHKSLIDKAFFLGKKITIGVTSDAYCIKKNQHIEPFLKRSGEIDRYISKKHASRRATQVMIDDAFGITLKDAAIDAIIVTKKTKPHAVLINKNRTLLGLPKLTTITIPYIKGPDRKIISSTRIRSGEIDREGVLNISTFPKYKIYLPANMRETLKKPLGKLVPNEHALPEYIKKENRFLITVGDVVSRTILNIGLTPDLSIIDYKTQRHLIEHKDSSIPKIRNPAGTITYKAVVTLWGILTGKSKHKKMIISGEEDLLALPALIFAPHSAVVIYGLAGKGIVVIEVDEEIKKFAKSIIGKFEKNP